MTVVLSAVSAGRAAGTPVLRAIAAGPVQVTVVPGVRPPPVTVMPGTTPAVLVQLDGRRAGDGGRGSGQRDGGRGVAVAEVGQDAGDERVPLPDPGRVADRLDHREPVLLGVVRPQRRLQGADGVRGGGVGDRRTSTAALRPQAATTAEAS